MPDAADQDPLDHARLDNDDYAIVERAAELIWQKARQSLDRDECDRISDRAVMMLFTAAVKLYARKCDGEGRTFRPVGGSYDELVTPTEALTATTEILRALRLGPMEFALWARRRPEDYHDTPYPQSDTPSE